MILHNKINREELKQKMLESDEKRITLSFYHYFHLKNPQVFRDHLFIEWSKLGVFGRVYVANEGIFLVVVDPSIENEVLELMQKHEKGKNAAIIGEITTEHPNKVVMESLIGGKRIVSPLVGEQLPRIC